MPIDEQHKPLNYFSWFLAELGPIYLILISGAALISFVLSLIVFLRSRGANAGIAWIFLVPLPVLIGVFGMLYRLIGVVAVLILSDTEIKFGEFVPVLGVCILPFTAMMLSLPTYLLVLIASLTRALQSQEAADAPSPAT